jgi:hypothetical protein
MCVRGLHVFLTKGSHREARAHEDVVDYHSIMLCVLLRHADISLRLRHLHGEIRSEVCVESFACLCFLSPQRVRSRREAGALESALSYHVAEFDWDALPPAKQSKAEVPRGRCGWLLVRAALNAVGVRTFRSSERAAPGRLLQLEPTFRSCFQLAAAGVRSDFRTRQTHLRSRRQRGLSRSTSIATCC